MGQKIAKLNNASYETYVYRCPGCRSTHQIPVKGKTAWGWNGCKVLPSFSPSILTKRFTDPEDMSKRKETTCHHYVKDGKIEFLSDCTHELAGKTVDMVDVPDTWKD